jgi:hypothetical protein
MPNVVVEIAPPGATPSLVRALLDSCSAAVRDGSCDLARDDASVRAAAVAIVQWGDAGELHVRVQIGVESANEPAWRARDLVFKEHDERAERWRSVGLTIATLAGEMSAATAGTAPDTAAGTGTATGTSPQRNPSSAADGTNAASAVSRNAAALTNDRAATGGEDAKARPDVEEDTVSQRPAPARRDSEARGDQWFRIGGAALVGPGLNNGAPRLGGALDVAWKPFRLPVFARLELSEAESPRAANGIAAEWQMATLGVGASLRQDAFSLEPRLAVGFRHLHASVGDPISRQTDSGGDSAPCFVFGADLGWKIGHFGFFAGLEGIRTPASTQILVENERSGTDPSLGLKLTVGARVFLE